MTVCYWCGAKDTLADVGKELDDCYKGYDCCELAFLEWLKQPHTAK